MNTNIKMREYIDLVKSIEESTSNQELDENMARNLLFAIAAVASLFGLGKLEVQHLMNTEPQLIELAKLKVRAQELHDEEKVKELDQRIKDTLNFIRTKERPVLDKHGSPVVPQWDKN